MIQIDVTITIGDRTFSYRIKSSSKRIVLFGPSGSGKSTLLKLLAGFFDPHRGFVKINDTVFFDSSRKINVPIHQRKTGYIPQEYTLFPHLTVKENIIYGGFFSGIHLKESEDKTLAYLAERLGLSGLLERMPGDLSGGEQQRVALARALYVKPSILLLDEPFSALDSETRIRLRDMVLDLASEMDIATFFVTHDLAEAYIMAEDMAVIDNGRIYESGPVEILFRNPRYIETARLLGFLNEFPIKECGENYFITETGMHLSYVSDCREGRIGCIHPDQIMILREDRDYSKSRENILDARIIDLRERIHSTDVTVTTKDHQFLISLTRHAAQKLNLSAGKKISISFKKESLIICDSYSQKETK